MCFLVLSCTFLYILERCCGHLAILMASSSFHDGPRYSKIASCELSKWLQTYGKMHVLSVHRPMLVQVFICSFLLLSLLLLFILLAPILLAKMLKDGADVPTWLQDFLEMARWLSMMVSRLRLSMIAISGACCSADAELVLQVGRSNAGRRWLKAGSNQLMPLSFWPILWPS